MDGNVPISLLHEGEGHAVTVELKNGELYRGRLKEIDNFMNLHMHSVTFTARDGRRTRMETVFLRGSQVRLVLLPDVLQAAPMLKKVADSARSHAKGGGKA
jgi:small nuclear ribonucleoprotein D3